MSKFKNVDAVFGAEKMGVLHTEFSDRLTVPNGELPKQALTRKLIRDSFNYFLSKATPGLMGLFSAVSGERGVWQVQRLVCHSNCVHRRAVRMVATGNIEIFQHVSYRGRCVAF